MNATQEKKTLRGFRFATSSWLWMILIAATAAFGIYEHQERVRLATEIENRKVESDRVAKEVLQIMEQLRSRSEGSAVNRGRLGP
jgi:hypothetical protein